MNKNAKKLIIVVDMVNGFVKGGVMSDNYINHITSDIKSEIEKTLKENGDVIFIRDSHNKDCSEFNNFPPHCINDTWESEVIDELKPYSENSINVFKNSTCAIFSPTFLNILSRYKNLESVEIVGCCTDICVYNLAVPLVNYFNQYDMDVNVIINPNMVETYDSENHNRDHYNQMALEMMEVNGVKIKKGKVLKHE